MTLGMRPRPGELEAIEALELELLDPAVRSDPGHFASCFTPTSSRSVHPVASGREQIVSSRHESPDPGPLEISDLGCPGRHGEVVVVAYRTSGPERTVRRASWWVRSPSGWQLIFHQGTPVSTS
jgi:hypothetical protein